MKTEEERVAADQVASSAAPTSPTHPPATFKRVTLWAVLCLLVAAVGAQAWFLRALRQEIVALKTETLNTSVGSQDLGAEGASPWPSRGPMSAFEQMERMRQAMNRTFDRRLDWFGTHSLADLADAAPKLDVREEPDRFIVEADVRGATGARVEVDLEGQLLTIEGNRESQTEQRDPNGRVVREEREVGSFSRSVTLPGHVASSGMTTRVKDGVLTTTIPKLSKG